MESKLDKIQIAIAKDLYEKIRQRVNMSQDEFKSVEEYVHFVLTEVVKDDEPRQSAYTKEEEEDIKNRLKSLGYI
ncbi:MAG: CopG family transcriptional regulator [Nitrososphaerales archaeon]